MTDKQDYFAGVADGWLLGLTPADFVAPIGFVVWCVLLYSLPLYKLDRDHTIGGMVFAIFYALCGAAICIGAPTFSMIYIPFNIAIPVTAMFLIMSLHRWNKQIFKNMQKEIIHSNIVGRGHG